MPDTLTLGHSLGMPMLQVWLMMPITPSGERVVMTIPSSAFSPGRPGGTRTAYTWLGRPAR